MKADHFAGVGKRVSAIVTPFVLAACSTPGTITEKEFVTVNVPVRAACPDADTKAKVDAARPVPLRKQVKPDTEEAVRAAERVQLARYEAPNGWADQAQAVMDSCAVGGPL